MLKHKSTLAAVITLISIASRLLPHPPNFTALGAGAMFGGAKIKRPYNYLIPLIALFLTDLVIGFHDTMLFVYGAFIVTVAIGEMMPKKYSLKSVAAFSLISSSLFFIITNLGVFLVSGMYPLTLSGLLSCFALAIPFYALTISGDLLYSIGIFSAYAYAYENKYETKLEGVNE